MTKIFIYISIISCLYSCISTKKYNSQLSELKSEAQLKADVDYAYQTLQKHHPQLYWYIKKESLDYKFDSLKASINAPMSSYDFYFKLSPVIASIRQGHLGLNAPYNKLTRKELKDVKTFGYTPFNAFQLELINNRLYVIKNTRKDSCLKVGTEIVSVNGIKPLDIFEKYRKSITADGFNQTYLKSWYNPRFVNYFYLLHGITDSVVCQLKLNDSVWTATLKRHMPDSLQKKENKKKSSNDTKGLAVVSKSKSKSMKFAETDSTVAVLKLRDFKGEDYSRFYSKCFKLLKTSKAKVLIIDLRNNGGGSLNDAYTLYSYLQDSSFYFIDKPIVTTRFSPLFLGSYSDKPILEKLSLPFEFQYRMLKSCLVGENSTGNLCFPLIPSGKGHPQKYRFTGKVYVLINGGSFSASCIFSANLKATNRAVFVGEETGGDYNGSVAGYQPEVFLPNSKLKLYLGLCVIQPKHKREIVGHGIFPDKEITPTLEDKIGKQDPVYNWVLNDVKGTN